MARRKSNENSEFMMDIMTAAIGCLVLILIAVLIIILVANVVVYIGDPNNMEVTGNFDHFVRMPFETDQPFPDGNVDFTPYYIDVWRDRLVFYPGEEIMPVVELREQENVVTRLIDKMLENEKLGKQSYVVLLIRPYSATVANHLRKFITDSGVFLGYELYDSDEEVDFRTLEVVQQEEAGKEQAEVESPGEGE